jgi:hypothetical protein
MRNKTDFFANAVIAYKRILITDHGFVTGLLRARCGSELCSPPIRCFFDRTEMPIR